MAHGEIIMVTQLILKKDMITTMQHMAVRKRVAGKIIFLFLVLISLTSCDLVEEEYSYLTNENIKAWYEENKDELNYLVDFIEVNGFSGRVSCNGVGDSALQYNDIEMNEMMEDIVRNIPISNYDECILVIPQRSFFNSNNKLESVDFPFISEGGCIVSGECVYTRVVYFPKGRYKYYNHEVMIEYNKYEPLGDRGWYINRNYREYITALESKWVK
jgi:hypothetical protein